MLQNAALLPFTHNVKFIRKVWGWILIRWRTFTLYLINNNACFHCIPNYYLSLSSGLWWSCWPQWYCWSWWPSSKYFRFIWIISRSHFYFYILNLDIFMPRIWLLWKIQVFYYFVSKFHDTSSILRCYCKSAILLTSAYWLQF